jgi:hypothetical protein
MSITDQFLQYAEEAILTASYDRSGKPPLKDDSPKSIGDSGLRVGSSNLSERASEIKYLARGKRSDKRH